MKRKKNNYFFLFFLILGLPLFCLPKNLEKDFVKASLSGKSDIIKAISDADRLFALKMAFDFAISNSSLLCDDGEFNDFLLDCVSSLPSDENEISIISDGDQKKISEKLMEVFNAFKSPELRHIIMDKLCLYSVGTDGTMVSFLNDYLSSAFEAEEEGQNILPSAIELTGKIGDSNSLSIIHTIWKSKIWPEHKNTIDEALVLLTEDSFSDAIRIFSTSSFEDAATYFSLLANSSKINQNSLCEIAENALLIAINNAEKLEAEEIDAKKSLSSFVIEANSILCDARWSHAANVVLSSLILSKEFYEDGVLSVEDFSRIIKSSANIPSQKISELYNQMLSDCNGIVEKDGEMPARGVVLALIEGLGALGEKSSFDTLLYVTYLSYPPEIVEAAKKSLALLKW